MGREIFDDKVVLVTGGTGSFGNAVARHFLAHSKAGEIRVVSRDEAKQEDMRKQIASPRVKFIIGDVRDPDAVDEAMNGVDYVFHAAALKQVPSCEFFPIEAVNTNVLGSSNVIRAAFRHGVKRVVCLSTDKAVQPVNAMGMTKALQERIFISVNILAPQTRFMCVRYGNVLASRGSVVPLFHEQILAGGPVTVTVPEMTRFLLSIDRAVETVFAAIQDGRAGEIFVPIVPSATVLDVARALIGRRNIEIQITGIRPGEKMHEIMVSEEECHHAVRRGEHYAILPMLPELRSTETREFPALRAEYSSADHVMNLQQTTTLLDGNDLLIPDGSTETTPVVQAWAA